MRKSRDKMTLAEKLAADKQPKPLRKYTFEILVAPPQYEIDLGISKVERKTITVEGINKADAMRRAGIQ